MQLTCGEIALLCAGVWRRYHRGVGAGVACTPAVRENVRPAEEERTTANGPGPIPDDVVGGFRAAPPATLGHTRTAGFVDPAIRPVDRRRRVVVGPAVTLTLSPGDVTHARGALGVLGAGRVLVIGAGGVGPAACWGEMTPLAAKVRNAAGVLVDGLVTDVVEIEEMDVPTRSRGIAALVVADDNGVVVIGPDEAEAVCAEARASDDHRPPHQRTRILGGGLLAELVGRDAAGMGAELAEQLGAERPRG